MKSTGHSDPQNQDQQILSFDNFGNNYGCYL
jgi:hypothetical protein